MTDNQRMFLERVKTGLRMKRESKPGTKATCTLEEVYSSMSDKDKSTLMIFRDNNHLNKLAEVLRFNPKVSLDLDKRLFSFKNQFDKPAHFADRLFTERIGVKEGQELYDDLEKTDIEALKNSDLVRAISIKQNKTKDPIVILFSKNHTNDPVDKFGYDLKTPQGLRDYWKKIDQNEIDRRVSEKGSTMTYLNNQLNNPRLQKKTEKRKKRQFRDYDNINEWQNDHILPKIEHAMKMLTKREPEIKKRMMKRFGQSFHAHKKN